MCGQAPINVPSLLPFSTPDEPEVAPLERRLRGSTGTSFPMAAVGPVDGPAARKERMDGAENVPGSR